MAKPVFLYLRFTSRKANSCTSKLDSSTSSQESTVRTPPNRVRVDIIVINCVNLGVQTAFYHPFWWKHRLQGPFLSLSSLELDDLSVSWKIWNDFAWKNLWDFLLAVIFSDFVQVNAIVDCAFDPRPDTVRNPSRLAIQSQCQQCGPWSVSIPLHPNRCLASTTC